ncbi:MAG TPA: fibronectin type III domain-containing protein, partial [Planctomycetota bacterium]|nr:fibronectin type III domain-containing protein [Planctomycetota bacterium]
YFRHWDGNTFAELSWSTPPGVTPVQTFTSADVKGGISLALGAFNGYPSLSAMTVVIPSTGAVQRVPVIAYDSQKPGVESIIVIAYWPGDPGAAATFNPVTGAQLTPNFPTLPVSWYAFGGGNSDYTSAQMSNTSQPFVSQRPSLAVIQGNPTGTPAVPPTPVVAWQDTRTGTHNIMVAQYNQTGFVGGPNLPAFPKARAPDFAFGNWTAMDGVSVPAPILANGAQQPFSILPSLALDAFDNPGVAWQQTFTVPNSDIFYLSWNGAAWVAPGGSTTNTSATTGGVSNTGLATTPSLCFNGLVPFIAWSDASPGNSEIFVRSLAPGGGAWNEVGFQSNSASTVATGGIGGISQTLGASLTPVIAAAGDVTVAWQDFDGGIDQIYVRRFFQNQPLGLRQTTVGGVAVVPFGATIGSNVIELRGTAFSEDVTRTVRMQVEVVPVGSPFLGNVTAQSGEVPVDANPADATFHQSIAPSAEMIVQFTGLENTNYQWRARTVDNTGALSAWFSAGGSDGLTDFAVSSASAIAPGAPQNLIVSLVNNQVALTWTAPAGGADSYNVKRSGVQGGGGYPPATIITTSGLQVTTTFTDITAASGQTYFYVVSSVRAGLESANSNEVTITVPGNAGGLGGNPDQVQKHRCGLTGAETLMVMGALAWLRRRRRR